MTKYGSIYILYEINQLFCTACLGTIIIYAASNNLISLWSRLVAPEQLSNSPSHLQGQHAVSNLDWQLRRVCTINGIRILSGTYLHNKASRCKS
jgi:hypothetical protein